MQVVKKKTRPAPEQKSKNTLIYWIILVFSFILFGNSIPNNYALDDMYVITGNKYTKQGMGGIVPLVSKHYFAGYFGDNKEILLTGGRYRPLFMVTFALEYAAFGENPHISHFINVIFYALTGILLFLLLKKLLIRFPERRWYLSVPFVATLLFLAHPVHTEVVANIKGRDEMMSLLGALAAFLFTLKYLEGNKSKFLGYSFLTFFSAMMSKESAVTFLFIIPLGIYFFREVSVRKILLTLAPLVSATVIFLILRYLVMIGQHTGPSTELLDNPFLMATTSQKFATIVYVLGLYLKLLVFPHPLTWDYYPFHIQLQGWGSPVVLISLAIYLLIGFALVMGFKQKKIYAFCILVFLAGLSLASNILFPIGTFMAERLLYLPSLGFSLLLAWFLLEKLPQWFKRGDQVRSVVPALLATILFLFSLKTIARNPAWKDDFTLYTTDVQTSTNSAKSNDIAGQWYAYKASQPENAANREELFQKAYIHLTKAVRLHPVYQDALFRLGNLYYDYKKDVDSTLYYYFRILSLNPKEENCLHNIDLLMGSSNDLKQKISTYERLHALNPGRYETNLQLGILMSPQDPEKALQYLEQARKARPSEPEVLTDLGIMYFSRKEFSKAREYFKEVLQANPQDTVAMRYLKIME